MEPWHEPLATAREDTARPRAESPPVPPAASPRAPRTPVTFPASPLVKSIELLGARDAADFIRLRHSNGFEPAGRQLLRLAGYSTQCALLGRSLDVLKKPNRSS